MKDIVIKVQNLSKEYVLEPENRYKTFRDTISDLPTRILRHPKSIELGHFWALKNINFSVERGSALGIIGANGAGKSTLLKILSRIVAPTEGRVEITGRTATMLEVGTGFNPELTGRENIYLNGAIIGMGRKEIEKKLDQIIDFSEIRKFIDVPVKKYSSGMQVRLAFSVAAHLEPEVLLLDEVLAVGDLSFQRKSLLKMHDIVKNQDRTVLFVSHNMAAVEVLCNKTLLLENGRVAAYGNTREVISKYISGVYRDIKTNLTHKKHSGSGDVRITGFWIENSKNQKVKLPKSGDNCQFIFQYEVAEKQTPQKVNIGFTAKSVSGQPILSNYSSYTGQDGPLPNPKGVVAFKFNKLPLAEGRYRITIHVQVDDKEADFIDEAAEINVGAGDYFKHGAEVSQKISPVYVDGDWFYENSR